MANKRMFCKDVVEDDKFFDMPSGVRDLYFYLNMFADDDGFVSPKKVIRMIGSPDDCLKILIAKGFVLPFESGVVAITHWKVNNFLRKDTYHPSIYQKELKELFVFKGVYLPSTARQRPVDLVSKLVSKKEGENVSEKGEEEYKKIENDVEKLENTENEENIKKEMQKIRMSLGIMTAWLDEKPTTQEPQEPQG